MTLTPETTHGEAPLPHHATAATRALRRLARPLAAALLIAYVTLAAFPGWFQPVAPGLDPSWEYALNVLRPMAFGTDLAFTYGPLGWVLHPVVPAGDLTVPAISWVAFVVLLGTGLTYHYVRSRSLLVLAAGVGTLLLSLVFGTPYEYQLLLPLGLGLSVPAGDRRSWTVAAVICAVLAATLLFVKTTIGVSAGSMVALAALWWIVHKEAAAGAVLVRTALPYAATFAVLGLAMVGPPGDVVGWLRRTLEIAGGFGSAMTFLGPASVTVIGLLALVVYGWLGLSAKLTLARDAFVPVVFLGALYSVFRHSYVRATGRYLIPVLLGIFAIAALSSTSRRRLTVVMSAVALLLPLGAVAVATDGCDCPLRPEMLGAQGRANLSRTVRLGEVERLLAAYSADELEIDRLPADWVSVIRESGEVDVVPWEISFTVANGLDWRPNPVIQTYHAYTEELDRAVAQHFEAEGPPHLLVQFIEIDGRYQLWSAPEMWRAIFSRYELVDAIPRVPGREGVALFRRRATPLDLELEPHSRSVGRMYDWIEMPEEPGLVFASLEMGRNLNGLLASALWRIDPLMMDFRFADGRIVTTRILPGTAGGRHLASFPPLTFQQFVDFLRGRMPPRAVAIRIHGPGAESFDPEVGVTWWTSSWMPAATGGPSDAATG
ncbi:MAG: hypothetical protein ACRDJP_10225 [Actinomycetota bacterium]